jgi:hypothetical protein
MRRRGVGENLYSLRRVWGLVTPSILADGYGLVPPQARCGRPHAHIRFLQSFLMIRS